MSNRYCKRDVGGKSCDFAMTLAEIGQELGISHERVRQIENQALAKARVILRRWGYTQG